MTSKRTSKRANPIDIKVGERVRLQRLTLGMSQGALAAKLGVTFQQVQKYEKGANRIGASRLQAVANALGVPISFFFSDAKEVETESAGAIGFLTPDGVRLNQAFLKISNPTIRSQVIELVRTVADMKG